MKPIIKHKKFVFNVYAASGFYVRVINLFCHYNKQADIIVTHQIGLSPMVKLEIVDRFSMIKLDSSLIRAFSGDFGIFEVEVLPR